MVVLSQITIGLWKGNENFDRVTKFDIIFICIIILRSEIVIGFPLVTDVICRLSICIITVEWLLKILRRCVELTKDS